jgi:hypothetical protein
VLETDFFTIPTTTLKAFLTYGVVLKNDNITKKYGFTFGGLIFANYSFEQSELSVFFSADPPSQHFSRIELTLHLQFHV